MPNPGHGRPWWRLAEERRRWRRSMVRRESEPSADAVTGQVQGMAGQHGGAGNTCSIRKLYIDLQRPPFGLLGVPHSAFVLGFVLKTWLTGQRKLQWTDGVTSKMLDAETLAEIIEAVVKDDGANAIKNEKLICRLSKEEKAFIEQSSVIFGSSPLADGTVEAALNAVGTRLEQISQRVPLWVLPEYIRAQADPSAEAMGKVIMLCARLTASVPKETLSLAATRLRRLARFF